MPSYDLIPHPSDGPSGPQFKLWVNVDRSAAFGRCATVNLFFCISAPTSRFVIPPVGDGGRRDELWQTTCFEAFLQNDGEPSYVEWNFSPSGDWAAYDFGDRRTDMVPADVAKPPYIRMEDNLTWWTVGATIAVPTEARFRLGLTAVIEEMDGAKSYWALAHPDGPPDFHDPSCFVARLPE